MSHDMLPLCEACSVITDGTHYTPKAQEHGRPFLTVKDMLDGGLDFENCSRISEGDFRDAIRNGCAPQAGDVLFSKDGTVGKVHPFTAEQDCAVLSSIAILRPKTEILDQNYFAHFLRSEFFLRKALRTKTGSAIRRIILANLRNLEIPLPPLEEQRLIAAILDKAGRLATACARLQATHRRMGESLFIDAFGDPRSNPLDLPSAMLGEIADCQLGKMLDKKRESGSSQRPYLRNANIRWFEVDVSDLLFMDIEDHEMERFGVCAGDLLVCEGGEPGRAAIWRGDSEIFGFQKALHRIRLDKSRVLPEYLNWALWILAQRGLLGDHITSATIAHLTREKLLKIQVLLPPLSVQERFARELGALDSLGLMAKSRSNLIRSLNSSLFSALVATGIS